MRWLLTGLMILACIISGLLGLTAGVNLNPQSTVRFVPQWGSLGDWVSGLGALLAVLSSLWLARRGERLMAEREKEDIRIEQTASDFYASVRIVSHGLYPVTVKAVLIVRPGNGAFSVPTNLENDVVITLPKRLEFREEIHFVWRVDLTRSFLSRISLLEVESLSDLRIEVMTVLGSFVVPLAPELVDFFAGAARVQHISLTRSGD